MGLGIVLTDEFGGKIKEIGDPYQLLPPLFPPEDHPGFPFLGSIDLYGNTVFNRIPIGRFLSEWAYVVSRAESTQEKELVAAIGRMACRCRDDVHVYLKFIGD
jgi:hypothetical protein